MKQYLLSFLLIGLCLAQRSSAAPGDTTWVQANNVRLDYYNNFDTSVSFPATGSFRKIYMVFTLGAYTCPNGSQYCSSWDYTVLNYVMTPTDTVELSRLITPYNSFSSSPRLPAGWKQRYVYDVTDFYPLLKGQARTRILYSGYSGGFTADVRFAFIEGTPERDVLRVQKLWSGSPQSGNPAQPINNAFPTRNITPATGAASEEVRTLVTGHGSDGNGCCEFLNGQHYQVLKNGTQFGEQLLWRTCGDMQLYPQTGTWIYDRANWCPGMDVKEARYKVPGITAPYQLNLTFDAYTASGTNYGSWTTEADLISFGAMNRTVDASLEDIISPTDHEIHYRENPNANPVIRVRNSGRQQITSIKFSYGVKDSAQSSYTWTGTLDSMASADIQLPVVPNMMKLSRDSVIGKSTFQVKIVQVNGAADQEPTNNALSSTFDVLPKWPEKFYIEMKTNNEGVNGLNSGKSETSWVLRNLAGTVVAKRDSSGLNTLYRDTLSLPSGVYQLEVTDGGCDGLHWWVYDQNPQIGVNAGTFMVRRVANSIGGNIPVHGIYYSGTYRYDFGCGFQQFFSVGQVAAGISEIGGMEPMELQLVPNPAGNEVTVSTGAEAEQGARIFLMDVTGKLLSVTPATGHSTTLQLSSLSNGIYQVVYQSGNSRSVKKLVIAH